MFFWHSRQRAPEEHPAPYKLHFAVFFLPLLLLLPTPTIHPTSFMASPDQKELDSLPETPRQVTLANSKQQMTSPPTNHRRLFNGLHRSDHLVIGVRERSDFVFACSTLCFVILGKDPNNAHKARGQHTPEKCPEHTPDKCPE